MSRDPNEDLTRLSLCRLLQNHTRTTSFSRRREVAMLFISYDEGLGCRRNWASKASFANILMVVRRFLRRSLLPNLQKQELHTYMHGCMTPPPPPPIIFPLQKTVIITSLCFSLEFMSFMVWNQALS